MSVIEDYRRRAERLTLVCRIVETFDDRVERKRFITRCCEAGILSEGCADLMLETYDLEDA